MNVQNNSLPKHAIAFGLSLSVCSLINALLVIIKEKSPAVQSAMQKLTGSHWITHSAIVLILFVLLGFVFSRINLSVNRLIQTIVAAVLVSGLIIVGFYLSAG
jgi:hypothetical protein